MSDAEIVSAEIGTEPMKIALLVANGRRIGRGQAINPLREAVTGFIEAIPPEHGIGLFTIGGHTAPPGGLHDRPRRTARGAEGSTTYVDELLSNVVDRPGT